MCLLDNLVDSADCGGLVVPTKSTSAFSASSMKTTAASIDSQDLSTLNSALKDFTSFSSSSLDQDRIAMDITFLGTTSKITSTMNTAPVKSDQSAKKSLFLPWICQVCQLEISSGQTWLQAVHMKKHRDAGEEPKD